MGFHERTVDAAKGKWRGILSELGVPESYLTGKHVACLFCQSKDNFRWDNKDGSGSWICTCGAGGGMDLAIRFLNADFAAVAAKIDRIVGNLRPDTTVRTAEIPEETRRSMLNATWREAVPLSPGDLVHQYLGSRGLVTDAPDLRFHPKLRDGMGGIRPTMVAKVSGPDGKPVTLHRTFLRPDGLDKAEMESPRKLMPGPIPDGACVRLSGLRSELCVAEGIETALAVERLFQTPCWATINASMMAKWIAPAGVESVTVFADNDASFTGHAAAYALAKRLKAKGVEVNVRIPPEADSDWNDFLLRRAA